MSSYTPLMRRPRKSDKDFWRSNSYVDGPGEDCFGKDDSNWIAQQKARADAHMLRVGRVLGKSHCKIDHGTRPVSDTERYLNAVEAALRLGVLNSAIGNWRRTGRLKGVKDVKRKVYWYAVSELDKLTFRRKGRI